MSRTHIYRLPPMLVLLGRVVLFAGYSGLLLAGLVLSYFFVDAVDEAFAAPVVAFEEAERELSLVEGLPAVELERFSATRSLNLNQVENLEVVEEAKSILATYETGVKRNWWLAPLIVMGGGLLFWVPLLGMSMGAIIVGQRLTIHRTRCECLSCGRMYER